MIRIRHSLPAVGAREIGAVARAIRDCQVGYGDAVEAFEKKIAAFTGCRYALATNSGSSALHLALLALGIGDGDRVILPSYCCAAVMNAVRYTGADPILVDIDEATFNIDPASARRVLTRRVKAIIVAHMFGLPADVRAIQFFGVPVIEDCSMSLGAKIGEKMTGTFGDIAITSFYATKVIATGSGGALFTNRKGFHDKALDLVNYDNRDNYRVRYNYRMNAINAAVGAAQISQLPFFLKRRSQIAEKYYSSIGKMALQLPVGRGVGHIFYRFVVKAKGKAERLIRLMEERGIECKRPVYRPLHRYFAEMGKKFPHTDTVYESAVSLPIYPSLSDRDVAAVVGALREVFPYETSPH